MYSCHFVLELIQVVGKGNDQVSITTKFEERLDTGRYPLLAYSWQYNDH